jgi:isoamylase
MTTTRKKTVTANSRAEAGSATSAGPAARLESRLDSFPTHEISGYQVRAGRAFPLGASLVPGGVNFSVFSSGARGVTLALFGRGEPVPMARLPLPECFRVGGVWSIIVFGLDYENIEYGYQVTGPADPVAGDRYDPQAILSDPHARIIAGRDVWGQEPAWENIYQYRSRVGLDDFDWDSDQPLRIPATDLVIYETHLRGFTRHPNSGVAFPGTYAGLIEKVPYLKELGVNAVELMPIFEFDEFENSRVHPETGERLVNYWGYSTVGFFAPKAGYAATGNLAMQVDEFKNLVRTLHRNGIEVILDVVFNHTAEGDERGPTISFRGLDNRVYYILTPEGWYYNFSGTGNTFNCNNPIVRDFILSCLRTWASEYHIDGFRFDLAAILSRDIHGAPLANPPLVESLAHDPVLRDCKLIAEAWDAGGLYSVGSFPNYRRWSEWNGKYRDTIRKFLKGDEGQVPDLATRLAGSPDLYSRRGTQASVNFITCHDGFTLADLVSYNDKHNEANGENNGDGANDNNSWNCGAEGPTTDPGVLALRERQMRNAFLLLLLSRGVPMFVAGDEVARTQLGNNNAYCHDSELSWFDWDLVDSAADLRRFVTHAIAFRAAHAVLRDERHPTGRPTAVTGYPDISWHGEYAWQPDWSPGNRRLALMWAPQDGGNFIYMAANAHWEGFSPELPKLPDAAAWHLAADTSLPAPGDIVAPGLESLVPDQSRYYVGPRSVVVLVGRQSREES